MFTTADSRGRCSALPFHRSLPSGCSRPRRRRAGRAMSRRARRPDVAGRLDEAAGAIVCLVNAERTSRGLRPLRRDGDLAQAARGHAATWSRRNYFAHVTPSGDDARRPPARRRLRRPGRRLARRREPRLGHRRSRHARTRSSTSGSPARRTSGTCSRTRYREIGVGVAAGAPQGDQRGLPGATYTLEPGRHPLRLTPRNAPGWRDDRIRSFRRPLRRHVDGRAAAARPRPAPATTGDWDGAGWRTPDPATLERQHAAFVELLDGLGVEVEVAEALEGQVDAVYMHDPLIMSGRGGIPLNMAKPARMREPGPRGGGARAARHPGPRHARGRRLRRRRRPLLARRHDGRDRARLPHQPQGRAGAAGAAGARGHPRRGLRHAARPGPGPRAAPAVVPVGARPRTLFVVYEPLAPVRLLRTSASAASTGSRSTTRATDAWAATSSRCGPGVVVMVDGAPAVRRALEQRGVEVHVYDGSDLSLKGDGGPTCLTAPLLRA